jgi:hypothetical protein
MLPFDDEPVLDEPVTDLPGAVRPPTAGGLPDGYVYGVTRYADIILAGAFPVRLAQLAHSLAGFRISLDELRAGGGGRTEFVRRFDESLREQDESWGKRNVTIVKGLGFGGDVEEVARVRGHEIDMFGVGEGERFPGLAVEMEWNNKDPFYDRDLNNFAALHREGAIAVGVIVTRGPHLQQVIGPVIRSKQGGFKYGQSTTHWNKLIPRVNLGGGGECPLLLVGIEPARVDGIAVVAEVRDELAAAEAARHGWRSLYPSYAAAQADTGARKTAALNRLPPV